MNGLVLINLIAIVGCYSEATKADMTSQLSNG